MNVVAQANAAVQSGSLNPDDVEIVQAIALAIYPGAETRGVVRVSGQNSY